MWFLLALAITSAHPLLLQEGYQHEKSILGGDMYTKIISDTHRSSVIQLPSNEEVADAINALIANPPKPDPNRLQQ